MDEGGGNERPSCTSTDLKHGDQIRIGGCTLTFEEHRSSAILPAGSGEGAIRCMKMAMQNVDGVDYVNTHGTSTPVGDVKELGAIQEVFGDNSPAISATKAMTGHALGAAGVHEAIYSTLMLHHGFIAPSINIDNLDAAAEGLDIVTEGREQELTTVMSNSFGFGGTNATLVIKKYQA